MTLYIWNDTNKLCNPHAFGPGRPYKMPDGSDRYELPANLYTEIAEDQRPAGYTDDNSIRTEDWNATQRPYIIWTLRDVVGVREVLWSRIKAHRDDLTQSGGAKVGVNWFHSDTHSKVQQLALLMAGANLPAGIQWKTMGGAFVEMTPTLAAQLYQAQMVQEQAIFMRAETHKAALAALPDAVALSAYDWKAGWPEVFVGVV